MPPAERGARINAGPGRRRSDRLRGIEGFCKFQPAVPLAKPGQPRAGQGVERSGAGQTFITPQPARHPMAMDPPLLAMRGISDWSETGHRRAFALPPRCPARSSHRSACGPGSRQFLHKPSQAAFEFAAFHDRLPWLEPIRNISRGQSPYGARTEPHISTDTSILNLL